MAEEEEEEAEVADRHNHQLIDNIIPFLLRDHPFVTALLLLLLIRLFYSVLVFFLPLIVSTVLCVLAFVRLWPLIQQEVSVPEAPHIECSDFCFSSSNINRQRSEVECFLREVYCSVRRARGSNLAKECSEKITEIVRILHELCLLCYEEVTRNASFLPDKQSVQNRVCVVGEMLGINTNQVISSLSKLVDELFRENPERNSSDVDRWEYNLQELG